MLIMGIESSCDDTGVAIYDAKKGMLANIIHSQVTTHRPYGGVVPELASRQHISFISILVEEALKKAKVAKNDLTAIAYTKGPGLIGSLLVGATFAKSFAYALALPTIAVNHLEAHILAAMLEEQSLEFPFLALLVSGGNTVLIEAISLGEYKILGETLDDAAGEAFDKIAKLIGLPYPGGPELAALADAYESPQDFFPFPLPLSKKTGFDFSFSGIKTHAANLWSKLLIKDLNAQKKLAYSLQKAIVDSLVMQSKKALKATNYKALAVAGGVSANKFLRVSLHKLMEEEGGKAYFPKSEYCTDNGAMIAYAGYLYMQKNQIDKDLAINVFPRLALD